MTTKIKILIGLLLLFVATVSVFSFARSNEENKVELNIGDKAVCPVMGGEFTITESTPVVEYNGKKYYFCCPGCDKEFSENPEKYIKEISTAEEQLTDDDIIGEKVVCLVSGDTFEISESTPVVEYEGKKYYFCCPGCDAEFMKNPEKYINQEKDEHRRDEPEKEKSAEEILYWTCSMHPEVKADEEGNCPICGMNLIPVYKKDTGEGTLHLSDRAIELAGIRMVPAQKHHLSRVIHTIGKVAYDPELVVAQEEYLNALRMMETMSGSDEKSMKRAESVVKRSQFKLKLLGMDESEIEKVNKTRQIESSFIIPENESWIYADVYESDISWIKKNQDVVITSIAYPGEEFSGRIRSINPVLDAKTRSARLRIQLTKASRELRPGMYVDVKIEARYSVPQATGYNRDETQKIVAVHKESILSTGKRNIVWVYLGDGQFQPREVTLGPEAVFHDGDRSVRCYPVLKGLEENELVVTNGNFLIDSESQLTGIAAIEYGGALGVEEKPDVPVRHQH
ncbi:MAG: efflux RND transporter periplasmic adaptor subunit [candidate division WOR-3 bacterium]|nr:MAG: efflux RND transporter periplasmic adaptor subunit [candidate division WOR-3 bacterium]